MPGGKRKASSRGGASSSSAPPAPPVVVDLLDSDEEEKVVDADAGKRRSKRIAKPVHPLSVSNPGLAAFIVTTADPVVERSRGQPGNQVVITFPTAAGKDSIELTYDDLRRLRRPTGQVQAPELLLLNDNCIDFYVKYLSLADGPPRAPAACRSLLPGLLAAARPRVHIFNSFFLKRLRMVLSKKHDLSGMLKWVQGVDLFDKVCAGRCRLEHCCWHSINNIDSSALPAQQHPTHC